MALTSASTITDAYAQLNDNLAWEGSLSKIQLALEAVRWIRFNRPDSSGHGDASHGFGDLTELEARLSKEAKALGAGAAQRCNFTRGRAVLG